MTSPVPATDPGLQNFTPPGTSDLRDTLLRSLATNGHPMSTADLRAAAHERYGNDAAPVVHEMVYRALLGLQRSGEVRRQRLAGRHTLWSLTPTGKYAAAQAAHPPAVDD
ncbi:hypothetical protein FZI85_27345 [Mycobacterium sp. CBMA293]|uniref:Transcriptional regulator PadR-like family protein n=1 Tax=Mycolicibacterium sp. CBMA 213 TaxID=1968788 RepID=A0A1S6GKM1_9MYCO|nr:MULTISPECIES: hypothetical protein [unclassified Mycolicibacterium]AQS22406.1 hypothetical protein pCBMA213_2_00042 [Mycolicibacterium sp. CBMA 213]MUL48464.1 hypothetical protein [Mycolicibacterium sp. CBMA 360]MUL62322.1 hypothetical protein [Mycolicibacterium sp. CBMA 335]MUM04459.1 hypothetical protein [Mycolicibacterium sp. CBMA 213]MUM14722.1 hypothetical protein [Mycolicibacterium sp. CBMA 293]